MNFLISPYEGAGNISFGMSVDQVRNLFNTNVKTFLKSQTSEFPIDAFDELGVQVHYKQSGVCHVIEFASPARPIFQNQELIGRPFNDILRWFEATDNSLEIDDAGLTSFIYGIGLYAPYASSSPDEPVEGVIIFEKGYYNSYGASQG